MPKKNRTHPAGVPCTDLRATLALTCFKLPPCIFESASANGVNPYQSSTVRGSCRRSRLQLLLLPLLLPPSLHQSHCRPSSSLSLPSHVQQNCSTSGRAPAAAVTYAVSSNTAEGLSPLIAARCSGVAPLFTGAASKQSHAAAGVSHAPAVISRCCVCRSPAATA